MLPNLQGNLSLMDEKVVFIFILHGYTNDYNILLNKGNCGFLNTDYS